MYPAFVNCTTIDWFSEWPADALLEVAEKYLDTMNLGNEEEVGCHSNKLITQLQVLYTTNVYDQVQQLVAFLIYMHVYSTIFKAPSVFCVDIMMPL